MTAAELWQRYQRYLCRVPAIGLTLDVSRMGFDDGFLDRMSAGARRRRSRRWTRWRRGRSPIPTRTGWSATTGCGRRNLPRRRRSPPRFARPSPTSRRSPRASTAARFGRRPRRGSPACCRSASAAPPSGRCSWPTRWATRRRTGCGSTSSTTPTRTASPATLPRLARPARRDAVRRRLARAAARRRRATACCWSPTPTRRPGSTSPEHAVADHDARLEDGPDRRRPKAGSPGSRCTTGSAAGRANCRPSGCCPAALQGLDIDGLARRRGRVRRGDPRPAT